MDFSREKCMQRIGVRAAAVYLSMAGWMGGLTLSGVPMCVWAKPDAEPSKAASKAFHLSPVQPKKRDPVVTLPDPSFSAERDSRNAFEAALDGSASGFAHTHIGT